MLPVTQGPMLSLQISPLRSQLSFDSSVLCDAKGELPDAVG